MRYLLPAFSRLAACSFMLAAALPATAQTTPPAYKVYTYVEQMPQLPGGGGQAAVVTAIQQHVSYPPRAMRAHAEGRVFVGFTVAASGLVEDVGLVKGFRPDCDSTVVAAVKQLPRFRPGMQAGQAVPVRFTVPVTFRLQAAAAPAAPGPPSNDSSRVYTSVQYMPEYRSEMGIKLLTADLIREFRAACQAAGCAVPDFPVIVDIRIGPSGVLQDVLSLNNMPVITPAEFMAGKRGFTSSPTTLTQLSPACEAALLAAGRRLPRLKPGSLNGRRVTVGYTLRLVKLDK